MSADFWQRAKAAYAAAVERGEHDALCEWRPEGFYICGCSKRSREADGYVKPPGELIHLAPVCPRCDNDVVHDGDTFTCYSCKVHWPDAYGTAEFFDDYGDVAADLAKWEAARARKRGVS